jgi:chemotaxis signal transduction protein
MDAARLKVLDRRTAALAGRTADAIAVASRPKIIWCLGDSLFGIDPEVVSAVIPYPGCTAVPGRQPAVLGVMSRMARFYSVIGLRRLLAMAEDVAPGHLLLLRGPAPYLALAVDRVLGRFDVTLPPSPEAPALILGAAGEAEGRLVTLFDPRQVLRRLGHAG